jgi:hypothetical protein
VVIITLPKEMFLRGMPRGLLSEGGAVRRSD